MSSRHRLGGPMSRPVPHPKIPYPPMFPMGYPKGSHTYHGVRYLYFHGISHGVPDWTGHPLDVPWDTPMNKRGHWSRHPRVSVYPRDIPRYVRLDGTPMGRPVGYWDIRYIPWDKTMNKWGHWSRHPPETVHATPRNTAARVTRPTSVSYTHLTLPTKA